VAFASEIVESVTFVAIRVIKLSILASINGTWSSFATAIPHWQLMPTPEQAVRI
jgi:hypothetical protein